MAEVARYLSDAEPKLVLEAARAINDAPINEAMPQLAALIAPRRLFVAGGITPQGRKVKAEALPDAYSFTSAIYKLYKAGKKLALREEVQPEKLAGEL